MSAQEWQTHEEAYREDLQRAGPLQIELTEGGYQLTLSEDGMLNLEGILRYAERMGREHGNAPLSVYDDSMALLGRLHTAWLLRKWLDGKKRRTRRSRKAGISEQH